MNDPIHVAIAIADETYGEPMSFYLVDEGAQFGSTIYTRGDLEKSIAILRDLSDMLEHKIKLMSN